MRDRKLAAASLESLPEEWKAIDVLVNNAGLVIGVDKEFEGNLDEWDIMIDTNIRGLLAMTRLVVPGMVERGRGHIINIGSIASSPLIFVSIMISHSSRKIKKFDIVEKNGKVVLMVVEK